MAGGRQKSPEPAQLIGLRSVYGDSLAEGMGYSRAREIFPPDQRGFRIQHEVGELSSQTVARVMRSDPPRGSVIVVMCGTNDLIRIGRGFVQDPEEALGRLQRNIETLMAWAKRRDVRLILSTIPPCASHRSIHNAKMPIPQTTLDAMGRYNEWLLNKGGAGSGARVLDLSFMSDGAGAMAGRYNEGGGDGLHPNQEGYVEIARRVRMAMLSMELEDKSTQMIPRRTAKR